MQEKGLPGFPAVLPVLDNDPGVVFGFDQQGIRVEHRAVYAGHRLEGLQHDGQPAAGTGRRGGTAD